MFNISRCSRINLKQTVHGQQRLSLDLIFIVTHQRNNFRQEDAYEFSICNRWDGLQRRADCQEIVTLEVSLNGCSQKYGQFTFWINQERRRQICRLQSIIENTLIPISILYTCFLGS